IGHAVHEELLLGVSGQVFEWQHGQRLDRSVRRGGKKPLANAAAAQSESDYQHSSGHGTEPDWSATRQPTAFPALALHALDWSEEAIPAARNGLDDPGLFGVIVKGFAQLGDQARQDVISNEGVRPDGADQAFFGHDFVRVLGQIDEHLHGLGLDVAHMSFQRDGMELRLDEPRANAEVTLQVKAPNCSDFSPNYSLPR